MNIQKSTLNEKVSNHNSCKLNTVANEVQCATTAEFEALKLAAQPKIELRLEMATYSKLVAEIGQAFLIAGINAEDRPRRHGSIDVGGAIQRVEHHDVVPGEALLHSHGHVFFLACDDASPAVRAQAVRENLQGRPESNRKP